MAGVSRTTGQALTGIDHITQSIGDILFTPKGSRVMVRDYGSNIPDLIDSPIGPARLVDVTVAAAQALDQWESRVTLGRVQILEATAEGAMSLRLDLTLTATGEQFTAEVAA